MILRDQLEGIGGLHNVAITFLVAEVDPTITGNWRCSKCSFNAVFPDFLTGLHVHAIHDTVIQNTEDAIPDQNWSTQVGVTLIAIPNDVRYGNIAPRGIVKSHTQKIRPSGTRVEDRVALKEHRRR